MGCHVRARCGPVAGNSGTAANKEPLIDWSRQEAGRGHLNRRKRSSCAGRCCGPSWASTRLALVLGGGIGALDAGKLC